ncbi:MAG: tRNA pseudouridine(55) synthase TruB [Clostridia bacterium]|nr:tRNA pseudouridine(55) synthase TruB [Clostridia bacterium]
MKGIINLNKPKNWTSRDAVNKVRSILHEKQIGHMGTLDPQGEGVLLIGLGKATRLFDAFLDKDKVYRAHFSFGYETDTLDGDGRTIATTTVIPSTEQIEKVLPTLTGKIDQRPPKYSAKSIGGVRAYDLARRGVEFEIKPAQVEIYSIKLLSREADTIFVEIHCSAGTYIRSVCRDLAYALNSLATMTSITRMRAGKFNIEDSVTIDELTTLGEKALISVEDALADFPRYDLPDEDYERFSNGIKICPTVTPPAPFTVYCKGELFGLGEVVNGVLKIKTYLRD